MKYLLVKRFAFVIIFMMIASSCGQATVNPDPSATASPPAAATATEPLPEELTIERDVSFGSGSFVYTNPRTGLAELSSYQARLIISFEGSRDGQPQQWSTTYTMLTTGDPQARQLTIESTDASSPAEPVFLAEMDGLEYERQGENACEAVEIRVGDSLGDRFEPASFLSGVIGAEEAGSETVNGVTANHYTFDQSALGEQDLTESTGELWVASEGNYIVKYLLTRKGNADYFGEGIEGTLTLDYQLTDPNQPVTIQLPEDCPPGLVDAPLLPDASNVEKVPGALRYNTSTSVEEAAAFYQQEIPSLGWMLEGAAEVTESAALLTYKKSQQIMTIALTTTDTVTTVHIFLENSQN